MKQKIVALVSQFIAIMLHGYLTVEYFTLKLGQSSGESLCNISQRFNCEAVTASPFSSFLSIPLSIWGLSANTVLLIGILFWTFRWTQNFIKTGRYCLYLACPVALASVVTGSISVFFVQYFCIFCIGAYICSFVTLFAVWIAQKKSSTQEEIQEFRLSLFKDDIKSLIKKPHYIAWFFITIPTLAFILNKSFIRRYEAGDLKSVVRSSVQEWTLNPVQNFPHPPLISKGSTKTQPLMVISEFADFLCGHCKRSATPLAAFTSSRQQIRFDFYAFPLDGACNSEIPYSSGVSCFLSKTVYCAESPENAWFLHDLFFKNQNLLQKKRLIKDLKETLTTLVPQEKLNLPAIFDCVEKEETHEAILNQIEMAKKAKVKGTPVIFVNQKRLDRGQVIPVLEAVYQKLKQNNN